jgi:hypothetical protein
VDRLHWFSGTITVSALSLLAIVQARGICTIPCSAVGSYSPRNWQP